MLASFLHAAVIAGTPLAFAILGEILTERAGKLNLGVEGMMLMGAVIGFKTALLTSNPFLALFGAALAGAAGALIFAFLTVTLRSNQVVTGLTLTIFGTGFASFAGQGLAGYVVPEQVKAFFHPVPLPLLSRIPFLGDVLFNHSVFVYAGYLVVIAAFFYLYKTRFGLNLRAVGENTAAADAAGINITKYKFVHILAGGILAGLGGAFLSLVYVPTWQDNITTGRGWIAVALVIFCKWNPIRIFIGAFLFGGLDIIGFRLQGLNIHISQYFFDMLPYIVTVLILIMMSVKDSKESSPPAELGRPYFREDK